MNFIRLCVTLAQAIWLTMDKMELNLCYLQGTHWSTIHKEITYSTTLDETHLEHMINTQHNWSRDIWYYSLSLSWMSRKFEFWICNSLQQWK